jgi:AraC-like DNA-binding protein
MDAVARVLSGSTTTSGVLSSGGVGGAARLEDAKGSLAAIRLTTDAVAPANRADWWRTQLDQRFGLKCTLEAKEDDSLRIDMTLTRFGTMTLIESISSPLCLRQTGNPGLGRIFFQVQMEGSWQVSRADAGGAITECEPNSAMLIHVRDDASYSACGAFRQVGVMFEEAALAEACPHWQRLTFRPLAMESGLAMMVRTHLLSLAQQLGAMDVRCAASMESPTLALIAAWLNSLDCQPLADGSGLPDFHRKRAKEFVLTHLCDPALSVEMIANAVGLSVRYLHKLFEDQPAGLMRWVAARRLEHCREKLSDPRHRQRTISDIAYEAGFNDLGHFSRSFRKRFQASPTAVRGGAPC